MTRILTLIVIGVFCFGCANNAAALFGNKNVNNANVRSNDSSQQEDDNPIMNPELANEEAPAEFLVNVVTTKGEFKIRVVREWSPNGADRFYNLVKIGYFEDIAIFRAIAGFMFQFGIHGDPDVSAKWRDATINDDDVEGQSNQEGFITFAKTGAPNSRSVQFFVNLGDNQRLDAMGFTPFGQVVEGMEVVRENNTEYGESDREDQPRFQKEGNAFVKEKYPNLDYIQSMSLVGDE